MPMISEDFRYGIRKASALVTLVAAATPITVYTPPGLALGVATAASRTFVITKIWLFNRAAAVTALVNFGTGLAGAFAANLPAIPVLAGNVVTLTEDEIPMVEYSVALTATATNAGATTCDIVVEVREFEGGSAPV